MGKIIRRIGEIDYNLTLNYNLKSFMVYFSLTSIIFFGVIYGIFKLAGSIKNPEADLNTSIVLTLIYGVVIALAKYAQHLDLKERVAFNESFGKIQKEFKDCFNLNELFELYNSLINDIFPKYYKRQYYLEISSLSDRIIERIKCIQLHPEIEEK